MDLETLMQNEEFNSRMEACGTVEEAAEIMRQYGLEVTAEQLRAALAAAKEGELDENNLEDVAGGVYRPFMPTPIIPLGPLLGKKLWDWIRNR